MLLAAEKGRNEARAHRLGDLLMPIVNKPIGSCGRTIELRAVITSHACVTGIEAGPSDQFGYCLFSNDGLLHQDTVSLRTARVFAAELKGSSPFMEMMATIAETDPKHFIKLVGRTFSD